MANFRISSLRRSCLVGVDVSHNRTPISTQFKFRSSDKLWIMFRNAPPSPRSRYPPGPRESLNTSCSKKAVGSCHAGGPFFSTVAVRSQEVSKVSKEPELQGLRHQCLDHVRLRAVPFVLSNAQEVFHLHACLSRACCLSL